MANYKYLLILLSFFLPRMLFAQQPMVDYSKADTLAVKIKYQGDIVSLTEALTKPLPSEVLKARAIFRWITFNIAYDCKEYNRTIRKGLEEKTFKCGDDSLGCEIRKKVFETGYINRVLDRKTGVCQGYAMLFQKMCGIVGIEAVVVTGYIRTDEYEIGTPGELDHAWNAVKLDGRYYVLDPTWASGGCTADEDGKLLFFKRHLNNYYWLTPPEDLARDHFPEDPKWVLIPGYTIKDFSANPYIVTQEMPEIHFLAPGSGVIKVKKGDMIHFKLKYTGFLHDLQINSNIFQNPDIYYDEIISKHKSVRLLDSLALKKQQYISYKRDQNIYEFAYPVTDHSLAYLDILFDKRRVMRFKVNVRD